MTHREPEPNTNAAIEFLKQVYPDGPWLLTAIRPDPKAIETKTFYPEDMPVLLAWLNKCNGGWNVYWSVNPPLRALSKKAEREDIKEVAYLHVDLDPRAGEDIEQERDRCLGLLTNRLPKGVPPATAVIFSGGGYQGFWKLAAPIPVNGDLALAEEAKRYNQQLERLFGGDKCHNIDRIMRLPGTINVPDKRKRQKGRTPTLATLVSFDVGKAHPLSMFTPAPAVQMPEADLFSGDETVKIGTEVERLDDINELDKWEVPNRVKVICVQGKNPDEPKPDDNSRSMWVYDCVCQLVRCGVPDPIILGILTNPDYAISESILEKRGGAARYAVRQIERAHRIVALDALEFDVSDNGKVKHTQQNIRAAMHKLGVKVRHDIFRNMLLIDGLPGHGPHLDDNAMVRLRLTIDERFHFLPGKEFFFDVISDTARCDPFHPVNDFLDELIWDGEPRLDHWLSTYGGAEDTEYCRAVGALLLIAAVKRVREPGCKFDEMVVFESSQGTNKSSALSILSVDDDWFTDDLPLDADTKSVIERLAGRWIVEAAELKGMRGQVEHLKAFLSRQCDTARLAYARMPVRAPRQCVIVGTTNSDRYLRDGTGNRRFWPVKIEGFDLDALRRDRDQLWAEAAAREAEGASIRLDPALWPAAAAEQDARRDEDPFVDTFRQAFGDLEGKVKQEDVWIVLGMPAERRTEVAGSRLTAAMSELGWKKTKLRFGEKGPNVCFVKGDQRAAKRIVVVRNWERETVEAYHEGERQIEMSPF